MRWLLGLMILVLGTTASAADLRSWQDISGKSVRAEFIGVDYSRTNTGESVSVRLKLEDGKDAAVAWGRLSQADRDFVQEQLTKALANKGETKITRIGSVAAANRVLAKAGSVNFAETSLKDACKALEQQYGVPFELDERALTDVAVSADTTVTLKLDNVSLKVILTKMLQPLEITFALKEGAFRISTVEKLDDVVVRTYAARDIIPVSIAGDGTTFADAEALIEMIQTNVEPDSWDNVGGDGKITFDTRRFQLIVSSRESVHEKLTEYFKTIRGRRR